ncbi:putative alkaline shock family protein YloU [Streptosporangium album]|uniref:Putative alkaline shock family protein YloU n=1 Tax=Streptosporangium album TaxID=47479 RepID=A0A7W7WDJ1_9ACTN|nr:Asp23/Gls24 family envelope stress response protein [Streptosporangium album]MBB4942389.1 putative alkaline shock family protein YloU [Streptosporangium album]
MTDVSVEEITEETDSPAETTTAARPFSLSLSAPPVAPVREPVSAPAAPVREPVSAPAAPVREPVAEPAAAAVVKGRIKVADEVVEKVSALAALEVTGVTGLGAGLAGTVESVRERGGIGAGAGSGRAPRGVSAHVQERTVAVDVAIVAEYGHVVMDVANEVKTNVARTVSRMLGMRVVEVNVNVEDVRLPGEGRPEATDES